MSQSLHTTEQAHLRQSIISQCIWSDTYSSLKHILKRTANQLPLLVSFKNTNEEQQNLNDDDDDDNNNHYQTIFFFDRNVSTKLLFTPLRQLEDKPDKFEIYPRHCTFATTDLFQGIFEFVRNGQRSGRIFTTIDQLTNFTTKTQCSVVFMSRDSVFGYYPVSNSSDWTKQEYRRGSIFHGQRIHSSSKGDNNHLECTDEDGYTVYLKMARTGRFSIIATSTDQQQIRAEIYLHSTQTPHIGQLIKRLTLHENNNHCIRLVRGPVPYNFQCQHLQFVHQHTHDILVGLTGEGLVIEWNLESHAPCRYATNLNDILNKLSGLYEEQLLETYIDQARTHYRENFQINMQLISTKDWAAFFQYWKWTGDVSSSSKHEKNVPYQSRNRFHLVASIQDLSDDAETLSTEFKKTQDHHHHHHHHHEDFRPAKEQHHKGAKFLSNKKSLVLAEMDKMFMKSPNMRRDRVSLPNRHTTSLLITPVESPFDASDYDSNSQFSSNVSKISLSKPKPRSRPNGRRTQ